MSPCSINSSIILGKLPLFTVLLAVGVGVGDVIEELGALAVGKVSDTKLVVELEFAEPAVKGIELSGFYKVTSNN